MYVYVSFTSIQIHNRVSINDNQIEKKSGMKTREMKQQQ